MRHHFKRQFKGDHLWLWGTTYGATDGPGGPSMATILGPGEPSTATYFAADGREDLLWGDHLWHDRPHSNANIIVLNLKRLYSLTP